MAVYIDVHIHICCNVCQCLRTGLGFVSGFIDHLQVVTTAFAEVCLLSRGLETGYIAPLLYSCVRAIQGDYRAVAWQFVDMSQYIHTCITTYY
jgi:hypothetical protein